jgi:hypothetical protein
MLVRPASQPCRRGRRRATRSPPCPSRRGPARTALPRLEPSRKSHGLFRGLLPRQTSARPNGTVVISSATSSEWSCVPAPRRRSRQLPSGVRSVSPTAQSSGLKSCRGASAILGAFHASTSEAERSEEPPRGLHGRSVRASTPFLYRGRHSAKKRGSSSQKTRMSFSEKQD